MNAKDTFSNKSYLAIHIAWPANYALFSPQELKCLMLHNMHMLTK